MHFPFLIVDELVTLPQFFIFEHVADVTGGIVYVCSVC